MAPTKGETTSQDNSGGDDGGSYSLAQGRSRREKVDKKGRSSAFEKLRKAKEQGAKHKYEVEEEEDVYEMVDEKTYSELVRERQEDDWIVDDDGAGYVEDGREIFDDEMTEDAPSSSSNKKGDKKKNKNIVRPGTKPKQDIKSMFAAASGTSKKKSEKDVSLANDDILGDLMGELGSGAGTSGKGKVKLGKPALKADKKPAYNPFKVDAKHAAPKKTATPPTKVIKRELDYPESPPPKVKSKPPKVPLSVAPVIKKEVVEDVGMEDDMPENLVVKEEVAGPIPSTSVDIKQTAVTVSPPSLGTSTSEGSIGHNTFPPDSLHDIEDDSIDFSGIDFDEEVEGEVKPKPEPSHTPTKPSKTLISEEQLEAGWEKVSDASDRSESTNVQVDSSQLPLVTNSAGEQVLRFYWLDAYEDAYNQPGVVYMFGKVWVETVKSYVSFCVAVKNIERRIYLLPREKRMNLKTGQELSEEVTMPMVYQEFDHLAEKHRILKFKSMKVKKNYAFEKLEVPVEADYLEVRYSADLPSLPSDLKGETFSHVFGTNTSSLELLLLGRKIKGPTWLELKCPQLPNPPTSWCKLEAVITKPENLVISDVNKPPPPLTVMTLNLRTLPNAKTKQNEIVAAACLIHNNFYMDKPAPEQVFQQYFCVMTKPSDSVFPFDFKDKVKKQAHSMKVEVLPTERSLIGYLLAKIQKTDPDLLVGHDIYGFDLDLLLHRINVNKIPHWSRISRLKRTKMPKITHNHGRATFAEKSAVCGRMMCDVQISAKELIRSRSYDLTELSMQVLNEKRVDLDYDEVREMYSSSQELLRLVDLTLKDSRFILRLMYELNVIPLALQITNICGNVMSRTLMGGRSERNEWLLLHAFTEKQYICPDKEYKKKVLAVVEDEDGEVTTGKPTQGKRKPAYAGGLVLEPKKGFYDTYILLLDFNSLYPSIIQEYNICFTTISRAESAANNTEEDDEDNLILPDPDLEPGVLPTEIRKLVDSRKQVKSLMKGIDVTPDQMMQYDIRQKALKLTANSMYGCLGFTFSRFYAKPLAALVTGKGREILMKTKDLVQNMNLDVIYGDTDSIMINTNCTELDQVFKTGNKVKSEVNKLYRLLEIDIDGVFKSMLLLKKKKYAALTVSKGPDGKVTTSQELKGLDIVRRDWCDLAKEAGKFVVDQILSGENRETVLENIHTKLQTVGEDVREGKIPLEMFHITKQLTKNPEDYPDKKSLAHVQVAMRYNSRGGKKMKAGDTVHYIICEDGSTLSATQRAYHPEELAKQDNLKIDTRYYLAQQLHPVVARLCDPIEGTDSAHIAECLGLDPSGYRNTNRQQEEEEEDLVTQQLTMEEKFQHCDRFTFPCPSPNCGRQIVIDSAFTDKDGTVIPALSICPNPECRHQPFTTKVKLKNLLQRRIQAHVNRYYQGWLKCEDTGCGARTNKLPLIMQRGHPICPTCDRGYLQPEYTDSDLYTQLCYYDYIFDVHKASLYLTESERGIVRKMNPTVLSAYRELKHVATKWLDTSAYSNVDLGKLFNGLGIAALPQVKTEREM